MSPALTCHIFLRLIELLHQPLLQLSSQIDGFLLAELLLGEPEGLPGLLTIVYQSLLEGDQAPHRVALVMRLVLQSELIDKHA